MKLRLAPRAVQDLADIAAYVRKHNPYLVYYTTDDEAEEIVILAIQHPAREREHSDA